MSQKLNVLEEAFQSLRVHAIHPEAPPEQVREMRRAFYAGAWAMFNQYTDAALAQDGVYLESLRDECLGFAAAVKAGRK